MINVPIDRIVPVTDARDNFSKIVTEIENQKDGLYVLTKGGKPAIALVNIQYLSEIMESKKTAASTKTEDPAPPQVVKKNIFPTEEKPVAVAPVVQKPTLPTVPPTSQAPSKPTIDPSWLGNQNQAKDTPTTNPPKSSINAWPLSKPISTQSPAVVPNNSTVPQKDLSTPSPTNTVKEDSLNLEEDDLLEETPNSLSPQSNSSSPSSLPPKLPQSPPVQPSVAPETTSASDPDSQSLTSVFEEVKIPAPSAPSTPPPPPPLRPTQVSPTEPSIMTSSDSTNNPPAQATTPAFPEVKIPVASTSSSAPPPPPPPPPPPVAANTASTSGSNSQPTASAFPEVKIPVASTSSSSPLPPPPINTTSIPFDQPPKTELEPGEAPRSQTQTFPTVPATPQNPPEAAKPQVSQSIKDIEI